MRFTALTLVAVLSWPAVGASQEQPHRTLFGAVCSGDLERARELLEQGVDPHDSAGSFGQVPFEAAMARDDVEMAELLLEYIDDIDAPASRIRPVPMLFLAANNQKFAKLLLEHKANLESRDGAGNTIMHLAILDGASARMFARRGARVEVPNKRGDRPLHIAVRAGAIAQVRFALLRGADAHALGAERRTAIHVAAIAGRPELIELFAKRKIPIDALDAGGVTALLHASTLGNVAAARALLEQGAQPDRASGFGKRTPLGAAARHGHLELAQLLVRHGAKHDVRDEHGVRPLDEAITFGRVEVLLWLVDQGANVSERVNGLPALCRAGNLAVANVLFELGQAAKDSAVQGWTPLHAQAGYGRIDIMRALLARGAEVDASSKRGETPLMAAAKNGRLEAVELLLDVGAEPDRRDASGRTARDLALLYKHAKTAARLATR